MKLKVTGLGKSLFLLFLVSLSINISTSCPNTEQKMVLNEVGQIDTNGEGYDVQVVGNTAYMVDTTDDNPGGLVIIDISDPSIPKKLGSYYNGGLPSSLFIAKEIAYLPARDLGLQLVNVSDPINPQEIGNFYDGGRATCVQIVGDLAFVADNDDGLEILNVSDPTHPTEVSQYRPYGTYFHKLVISDSLAYVTDHQTQYTGIRVLNISDPTNVFEIGKYEPSGIDFIYPYVSNDYFFAANHYVDTGELIILDVSDPADIKKIGEFNSGGMVMKTLVDGDLAYVTDFHEGFKVLNINDPSNPVEIGHYYDDSGHACAVVVVDSLEFIADDGLEILEISFEDVDTSNTIPGFEFLIIFSCLIIIPVVNQIKRIMEPKSRF
ncbi:MAG: LVIVD repeat-containing protein [Candidatus Hodarchaeota archaeon]